MTNEFAYVNKTIGIVAYCGLRFKYMGCRAGLLNTEWDIISKWKNCKRFGSAMFHIHEKLNVGYIFTKPKPSHITKDMYIYTALTSFSTKYLVICKVFTDVGGIK